MSSSSSPTFHSTRNGRSAQDAVSVGGPTSFFVGFGFAAIAIGALVPAAVMSIGAANLFTRNFWKAYVQPGVSPAGEAKVAKIVSLVVKLGALAFIIELPTTFAIQLQLLGGIIIIQTLPSVILGLYTNRLHPWALLIGWAVGIGSGTAMAASLAFKVSIYPIHLFGLTIPCYAALSSLALNIVVSVALSWAFNATLRTVPSDTTAEADYV